MLLFFICFVPIKYQAKETSNFSPFRTRGKKIRLYDYIWCLYHRLRLKIIKDHVYNPLPTLPCVVDFLHPWEGICIHFYCIFPCWLSVGLPFQFTKIYVNLDSNDHSFVWNINFVFISFLYSFKLLIKLFIRSRPSLLLCLENTSESFSI